MQCSLLCFLFHIGEWSSDDGRTHKNNLLLFGDFKSNVLYLNSQPLQWDL